jgi:hypothetical protein
MEYVVINLTYSKLTFHHLPFVHIIVYLGIRYFSVLTDIQYLLRPYGDIQCKLFKKLITLYNINKSQEMLKFLINVVKMERQYLKWTWRKTNPAALVLSAGVKYKWKEFNSDHPHHYKIILLSKP